jgi:microcystin-dependent protein
MAEIGDKVFTTELMNLVKEAVRNELGSNAFVNRYLAEVTAVDTATSAITVKLSGSDTTSANFRVRGLQMPSIGDQVIACIDGEDRWIDSVVRPATSTPYLQISSGAITGVAGAPTGSVVGWLTGTAPTGWLFCDGTSYAYNTYPALGALLGGSPGGNFTTPDMRDRFLGSLTTVGAWSNTTGTIGPNSTITNDRAHTHSTSHSHTFSGSFSGSSHTHDAAGINSVSTDIAAFDSGSTGHTHTAPNAVESTGAPSAAASRLFPSTGTSVSVPSGTHTHSYQASAWTTNSTAHTHTVNVPSHDHTINVLSAFATTAGGSVSGTVGTDTTATGAATYGGTAISPKATRLNFIIKT